MTLRQPHQDAFLAAGDAARLRQVLIACSQLLSWAQANSGPQFAAAAQEAAEVNLAIDTMDFSHAGRRAR